LGWVAFSKLRFEKVVTTVNIATGNDTLLRFKQHDAERGSISVRTFRKSLERERKRIRGGKYGNG
jgi:hypothetical protein